MTAPNATGSSCWRKAGVRSVQFAAPLPEAEFAQVLAGADILVVNEKDGMSEMSVPGKLTTYFSTSLPVLAATDETSVTSGEIRASGGTLRRPDRRRPARHAAA